MGPLLGPEDTEINIEIVLIFQSFQGSGRSRLKQYVKGTERVEVISWVLGRHQCMVRPGASPQGAEQRKGIRKWRNNAKTG